MCTSLCTKYQLIVMKKKQGNKTTNFGDIVICAHSYCAHL